jgi:hypothetical protein
LSTRALIASRGTTAIASDGILSVSSSGSSEEWGRWKVAGVGADIGETLEGEPAGGRPFRLATYVSADRVGGGSAVRIGQILRWRAPNVKAPVCRTLSEAL